MNSEIYEDDGLPGGLEVVEGMLPALVETVAIRGGFTAELRLLLALLIGSELVFALEHMIKTICEEEGL